MSHNIITCIHTAHVGISYLGLDAARNGLTATTGGSTGAAAGTTEKVGIRTGGWV